MIRRTSVLDTRTCIDFLRGTIVVAVFRLFLFFLKRRALYRDTEKRSNFTATIFDYFLHLTLVYGHSYHMSKVRADMMVNLLNPPPSFLIDRTKRKLKTHKSYLVSLNQIKLDCLHLSFSTPTFEGCSKYNETWLFSPIFINL